MTVKTVIISGSGRSGTTWVLDSLAQANRMRTVFEPLHPVGVPAARRFAYQYVDPEADFPELRAFMDPVLSGGMRSLWANYRIRPDRFNPLRNSPISVYLHIKKSVDLVKKYGFKPGLSGQIVKFIRANLMLPWLVKQYGLPTILVVRHPCAVIASRLKLSSADWSADKALGYYKGNRVIHQLIGERFGVDIDRPMSSVSALCCVWCIENVLPLQWAAQANYGVVSYENLLVKPETEWPRVIQRLELKNIPDEVVLKAPSQQSALDMRDRVFTPEHLDRWRKRYRPEELASVADMLERFGCDFYSVESAMPNDVSASGRG